MMIGAICGDFIGSVYEHQSIKSKDFPLFHQTCRFTDDTVLTVATMDALINKKNFTDAYKFWYRKYPQAGYGGSFIKWAAGESQKPYNSWGNGSAMRKSLLVFICHWKMFWLCRKSASVTHNHRKALKGTGHSNMYFWPNKENQERNRKIYRIQI